jgi:hypothetical protein
MKTLLFVVALAVSGFTTSQSTPIVIRASAVPAARIIDGTHLHRRSNDEIEIVVVRQARAGGLLTFLLDRQPTAKLDHDEAIRLYLSPGRHRFGVVPSYYFGHSSSWEMTADVSRNKPQAYRIFQSSGFTSSGGTAVYEISNY